VADRLEAWLDYEGDEEDLPETWISGKEQLWSDAWIVVKNGTMGRDAAVNKRHTFLFDYTKDIDVSVFNDCAWLREGYWTPTLKLTLESATNMTYTLPPAFVGIAEVATEAERYNIYPQGTVVEIMPDGPADGYYFDSWEGDVFALNGPITLATNAVTMPFRDIVLRATYTTNAPTLPPGPSPVQPQARITALAMKAPSPAMAIQGAASPAAAPAGASLVLMFEGLPQTDYVLEWTPALGADANWQRLTVVYREVLGDTADGRRQIRLTAAIPPDVPQGFFRMRNP